MSTDFLYSSEDDAIIKRGPKKNDIFPPKTGGASKMWE